jgi:hypothetical protein
MKKIILLLLFICRLPAESGAQWAVFDPTNLVQNLITANNTVNNVAETSKILEQGERYYNSLREVSDFVRNSRNVYESIAVSSRMLREYNATLVELGADPNFTAGQIRTFCRQQNNMVESLGRTIGELYKIIVNTGMSMSDKERLDATQEYHRRVMEIYRTSGNLNLQMRGLSESINRRKKEKRLERELLR